MRMNTAARHCEMSLSAITGFTSGALFLVKWSYFL